MKRLSASRPTPRRRSRLVAAARQVVGCAVESLESRRLLCTLGHDDGAVLGAEPIHLYDSTGHHLNLNLGDTSETVIPDPSLVDWMPPAPAPAGARPGQLAAAAAALGVEAAATPAPAGALTGKIIYMNAGHGWTYNGSSWLTQRPEYQEIVEDLTTQDQITFYAQYLLNAGATVVPMRPLGHQLNELIVDNNDAGFSTPLGSWSTNTTGSTYWSNVNGTDSSNRYRFANPSPTESTVARFTPNIPATGFYPVYTWVSNGPNRVTDQTYRINSAGGSQEVRVNHKYTGKGWIYLGNFYFEAGTGGNVEVSNKSGESGAIIADAIRFGNGMGTWQGDGTGSTSGKPKEEELSLYWLYQSRGWTGSGARVAQSTVDGNNSGDSTAGVVAPPRWASYMNDETQGTNVDRLHLSVHSNGTTGLPDASARGTLALIHSSSPMLNQAWWANQIAEEIEEDMQLLPAGVLEHTWASRTNTLTGAYGEISKANFDAFNGSTAVPKVDEMSGTLLEVLFHDNLQDSQLMRDPKVRDWVGRSSYQATVKYFANFAGASNVMLPEPPSAIRATTDSSGNVILNWSAPATGNPSGGAGAATGYKIYYGSSGYTWSDVVTLGNVTSHTISGLPLNQMRYFKVVATNAGGESLQREVVAAKPQSGRRAPILIVNGFDRFERTGNDTPNWSGNNGITERVRLRYQNTRDYTVQVAEAIEAYNPNLGVETAQNEQVGGAINLANYHTVIWISGEESTVNETFSAAEQTQLTNFLNAGGKLFTSGAEIGWDLEAQGGGVTFFNNQLKAKYFDDPADMNDNPDDAGSYTANGVAGSIFAGITSIVFDSGAGEGASGTYDVETPDQLGPINGSVSAMTYATGKPAAVQWNGGTTRVVTMGFPFETITAAAKRNAVMGGVLGYFSVNETILSATPTGLTLANGDSGVPDDNRTFRNNTNGLTLQFHVTGTVPGATVRLYSGATEIGSFTAVGTTTVVTTDNTTLLSDGVKTFTARQTEPGKAESASSPGVNVTIDTAAAAAPAAPVATPGDNAVALDWPDVVAADLWGYNVYRGTASGGPYTRLNGTTPLAGSAYNDTTAVNGTAYFYVVRSVDTAGNISGDSGETPATPAVGFAYMDGSTLRVDHTAAGNTVAVAINGGNVDVTQNATTLSFALGGIASIVIAGTAGNDTIDFTGPIAVPVTFNGGTGIDQLNVKAGAFTFTADAAATTQNLGVAVDAGATAVFDATQHLDSLVIDGLATLTAGGAKVLVTKSLDATDGKLDLTDNDLVIDYSGVSPVGTWAGGIYDGIAGRVQAGRNGGAWDGASGIVTSMGGPNDLKTLAVAEASDALGLGATATGLFSGETVDGTSVLVKHTWGGDANLDGKINVDDYGQIDFNVGSSGSVFGYFAGDFNYDGKINVDDYGVIDFNVSAQDQIL